MIKHLSFLVLWYALTACGGGATSSETAPTATSPFAQSATDTIAARVATNQDTELSGRMTTLRNNLKTPDVAYNGMKSTQINLVKTQGGYSLTAFGQTQTFTDANLNSDLASEFVLKEGPKSTYLWTFEDSWETVESGQAFSVFLIPYGTSTYDEDTGINMRGYGVFGLETTPSAVNNQPNATYTGQMITDSYVNENPNDIFQMWGRVTLNADFGSDRVDGRIDQIIVGDIDQPSEFIIEPANINGNGYATTLRYDPATCANCGSLTSSYVEGRFYGNAAQETGGTITFQGISEEGYTYVAVGVIEARR